jgi:hypothetical protein
MALAAQLIFFIFRASPSAARPVWPTSAQAGPSPGRCLPSTTEATTALPSCRRTVRRHQPPSHTQMELNRSAAQPPSLSHTSSVPHRLPSPIQCKNRRGLKIHRRRPPPLPSTASPAYKRHPSTAAPHRTTSHFLLHLSVPPPTPHRAPPLPFIPLCHRPYLAIEPVARDLGEVPRLPLFVLKPSRRVLTQRHKPEPTMDSLTTVG